MKATGIVRRVDELGRIVVPIELRRNMSIEEGDALEVFVEEDKIILMKYLPGCHACNEFSKKMLIVGNLRLCQKCQDHVVACNLVEK